MEITARASRVLQAIADRPGVFEALNAIPAEDLPRVLWSASYYSMANTKGVLGEVLARKVMQAAFPTLKIRITAKVTAFSDIFRPLKAFPDLAAKDTNGVIKAIGEVKAMTKETFMAEKQLKKMANPLEKYNRKFPNVADKRFYTIQENIDLLMSSKAPAAKRVRAALSGGGWIKEPISEVDLEGITRTKWAAGA